MSRHVLDQSLLIQAIDMYYQHAERDEFGSCPEPTPIELEFFYRRVCKMVDHTPVSPDDFMVAIRQFEL